jgi:GNAT-like C-terminal domain/N-acyltransferase N-terminal domain
MSDVENTLKAMRAALAPALPSTIDRLRTTSAAGVSASLEGLGIARADAAEIARQWDGFRRDDDWVELLGGVLDAVSRDRGRVDAPIHFWRDLDDAGAQGRLFYFYVFALACEGTASYLARLGTPDSVIEKTFGALPRHRDVHQRKWGTLGVDAGWWMLLVLSGELIQIGSLQFHREGLGAGTISPSPWFSDEEMAALGEGFRKGDPSLGLHIPDRTDLSPAALDETFESARSLLGQLWPVHQRRLATCQSWMMDERLSSYLDPASNVLHFQRRFSLLPKWRDGDEDVVDFVFAMPGALLSDLPQTTSLERAIVDVLREGHWHDRTGWLDFDGCG